MNNIAFNTIRETDFVKKLMRWKLVNAMATINILREKPVLFRKRCHVEIIKAVDIIIP